jgi:hypothetical protein
MDKNPDDTYRENLRKKLGLGASAKVVEEVPAGIDENPNDEETLPPKADVVSPDVKEQVNPAAEAILNEVLQFVDEKEDAAKDTAEKRMAKAFWVYLNDNKDKIHKIMVGKAEKAV